MENSKIEWTDHTFNPWWGCLKVDVECEKCYALTEALRWGHDVWGPAKTTSRRFLSDLHWKGPLKWEAEASKSGVRKKVFCASMADVFEENPEVSEERVRLWELISRTPNLDWLLLTKRPENIMSMIPVEWHQSTPANIWMGTSIGANRSLRRVDELKKARAVAKVLFISAEPLLEEVNFAPHLPGIDWVIVGGESGHGRRPFNPDWARSIRSDCNTQGVSFFMKQWDKIREIPEDLMIREFPVVAIQKSSALSRFFNHLVTEFHRTRRPIRT